MASANHYSDESSITTPTSAGFTVASNSNDVNGHADGLAISHRSSTPPLLRAPTGQAFAAHVKMWGPSEIASFLNLYKCDKYTSLFHQNDIDGKVLLDLDMSSLKEIGISKVGDRVKLLGGVRDLRKRASRATTPLTLVNSRVLPIGVSSVEGSPLPVLEQDPRGAQVPKRLAAPGMSGVSKRLQQSRPPPLNLRPSTVQSLDHSSLMTVTPKSFHPQGLQKVVPVPGPETRGVPGYDLAPHLRPPQRDIRRSPSPVHELAPAPKIADRRPLASRPSDRVPSPTNPSTQPRDGPPHPFAIHDGNKWSNRRQGVPQVDTTRRTLEDRRIIKFVNSEDGTSKKIDLPNASSGVEVLELVLRKFGKGNPGSLTNFNVDNDGDGDALQVDGWSVFLRGTGEDDYPLTESALLDICNGNRSSNSAYDQVSLRGLILRRSAAVNRKNMVNYLGDQPPRSPISPSQTERDGMKPPSKNTNRASIVSVLSALGVPGVVDTVPAPNASRSPSNDASSRTKKMYNFFGHRPPSELISNHLSEYFPHARKRDLEKTARQSMLRLSQAQSDRHLLGSSAQYGLGGPSPFSASLESVISPNRKGRPPSTRTVSSSTTPAAIPEEVEVPNEGPARRSASTIDEVSALVGNHPPLLPPIEHTGESFVDSLQEYSPAPAARTAPRSTAGRRGSNGSNLSRISVLSSIRRSKDKSDSASLLTVDEITAEVENRRASMTAVDDSYDQDGPFTPVDSDEDVSESDSDDDDEDNDDDDDDDDEDDDSEGTSTDEGRGHVRAFTSTGSKRNIKWIKGALIGAGSFGEVFLGMDAQSGLLMAVKQVELPSGDARNEEKKRNMVQALEREIELLKELAHPNIVQYLDSASDGNHLNIFLEYVPGGSVAALLNNYGAFEEALVRNFVRQILQGLSYLHEREIIHRDIKGANILVDNKGGIKISDFGISKKAESSLMAGMRVNRPSLQGSVFWMAPEVVKQTSYTSKADIWSVGCLVVEMLTGTHPWADLTQMQAMYRIGTTMARPATPSDISPEAAHFLQRTFEVNHNARPTAAVLLEHPFINVNQSPGSRTSISLEQASATLGAAAAARNQPMPGLSGLGLGLNVKQ